LEDRVPHAAAVTAGVVLEQHVRRLAQTWEVDTHAKDGRWLGFQDLSQRLSKAGAYSGTVHAEAVSWYKIRTVGAHEPPDRSDPAQVRRMLHGVRDFVASHPA
jgi:hypothetical protein